MLAEVLPKMIRDFPWPKSMRWGAGSTERESLRWVRPLHAIVATFGPETEDPVIVDFSVDGIVAGDVTYGHRFMAPEPIKVRRFDDYQDALRDAKVVLDAERRKDIILHDARDRAFALSLEMVEDEALTGEVAGLNEWPVVLVGTFDEAFLEIPPEVIRATIRANQKCFVLRDPKTGALASRFVMVANIEASDGGKEIVAGNERVIRARLADARHFWETDQQPLPDHDSEAMEAAAKRLSLDLAKPLDQRMAKLAATDVVFHEKLGTQGQRVERIVRLARELATMVGADPDKAARAAALAKADLTSEMVGEFPELQGLMGRYYAAAQGEDGSVAIAIEDHYKPQGPGDSVPTDPVAIAVALADKLDILVGFWAIDEKPTGSKDPYALRRAALGVIRIVLEADLRQSLSVTSRPAHRSRCEQMSRNHQIVYQGDPSDYELPDDWEGELWGQYDIGHDDLDVAHQDGCYFTPEAFPSTFDKVYEFEGFDRFLPDLLAFFADRLKVQLRDEGARHDLVDAVFALGNQDDLLMIVRRVEALGAFLDTEDGQNLLTGYRRAANILRDEEKKSGDSFTGDVDAALLSEPEEIALHKAIIAAETAAASATEAEDFAAAMRALAGLRAPVDTFFDKILVNAPDQDTRANRLRLLGRIREAMLKVADFSRIEG